MRPLLPFSATTKLQILRAILFGLCLVGFLEFARKLWTEYCRATDMVQVMRMRSDVIYPAVTVCIRRLDVLASMMLLPASYSLSLMEAEEANGEMRIDSNSLPSLFRINDYHLKMDEDMKRRVCESLLYWIENEGIILQSPQFDRSTSVEDCVTRNLYRKATQNVLMSSIRNWPLITVPPEIFLECWAYGWDALPRDSSEVTQGVPCTRLRPIAIQYSPLRGVCYSFLSLLAGAPRKPR